MYKTLKNKWLQLIEHNSIDNNIPAITYLHSLLGAYFKNVTIRWGITGKDVRVHPCWFQNSRTGKGQLNKIYSSVGKECGLSVQTYTDFTSDASLIGTYDVDAHTHNVRYGLSWEEPVKETKGGKTISFRDPIIKGDLAKYDVIIFDESKLLFQIKSAKVLTNLQPSLDHPGRVHKKMKHEEPIEYDCDCTLVLTSIPFDEMRKSLVSQGFFQRTALFIRRIDIDTISATRKKARTILRNVNQEKIKKLQSEVVELITQYDREHKEIIITNSAERQMDKIQNKFIEMTKQHIRGDDVQNCLSFSQSVEEFIMKAAAHVALLKGKTEITDKEINEVYHPARFIINTVFKEISMKNDAENKKEQKAYYQYIKKLLLEKPMKKTELRNSIMSKFNIGQPTASRQIEVLTDMNYLQVVKGERNTILLKINN